MVRPSSKRGELRRERRGRLNTPCDVGTGGRKLGRRARPPAVLSVCIAMLGSLALAPAPAMASISHVFAYSFGSENSNPVDPYPLSEPTDVEINQTSHDLYVTDPGNHRIEMFDSSGHFLLMFGKEVNKTAVEESATRSAEEDICPSTGHPEDVCQAGASASSAGAFQTPYYLAVDNSGGPSTGDIYVADTGDGLVSKFDSSGHLITTWGAGGQKDGSDADFGPFDRFGPLFGVAVGGPNGELYVGGNAGFTDNFWIYTQDGTPIGPYNNTTGEPWLKAGPEGTPYSTGTPFGTGAGSGVYRGGYGGAEITTDWPTTGFAFDPSSGDLYQAVGTRNEGAPTDHPPRIDHYSSDCNPPVAPCDPLDSFGSGQLSSPMGVAVDGASQTVYVADSTKNDVAAFGDARPIITVGQPTGVTESSVTLTAHIDPAGRGDITNCYFEYGFNKSYGTIVPCVPDPAASNFTGPTDVTATITGFSPGTKDHYRLVVSNAVGATRQSNDETFITTQPPSIDGLASGKLTASSAELTAEINPNGLRTTYQFKFGPTTDYGKEEPEPEGTLEASNADQAINVPLSNLTPHVVYHYTVVATNADGTTTTEDHTFNFYPPSCPNENVRQQTETNYLPDCRAYELVSPENAGGTQLYPGGPNTGYATTPSRFAYTGLFATIPDSGGSPIDGRGDLYVATRTDTGWVSRYVGLPSNQAAVDGGPNMGPVGLTGLEANGATGTSEIQNFVLTDPAMDAFLDFNDGNQAVGTGLSGDFSNPTPVASNAPYLWGAEGSFRERWPTNLDTVPGGSHALDCPGNDCPGDVSSSSDLSHFVFATESHLFAPEGQLGAPGSVYDNDTRTQTVTVASKTAAGAAIPAQPTDRAEDPLRIPSVSSNGTRILIAAGGTGPCGSSTCPVPSCGASAGQALACPLQPSHLYMRVEDAMTYDISQGHDVRYVGMTSDGSKVYFTSAEQLTPEDTDTSTDLYMWSQKGEEEGRPLTLISKADPGSLPQAGNTNECHASWVSGCGVVTYFPEPYCQQQGGQGGNCISDSFIASDDGDIYFFSPEQLDGSRGIPGQENLYVYRNERLQYVTTFTAGSAVRMEVNPDDSYMALVTASPLTQYLNAGHLEMYRYQPSTETLICVSCNPSGAPATSDVGASQDGLFMTEDGRTFFTTDEALVHGDTNQGLDVYEYVDGQPQLITPGTGETSQAHAGVGPFSSTPGLVGVSANGTDVYFSTFSTLVSQDHNGLFLKFYDARSGGGFSAPAPPPPCEAADECHGAGSMPPIAPPNVSTGELGAGGNYAAPKRSKVKRAHTRKSRRHHKRAEHRRNIFHLHVEPGSGK